MTTDSISPGSRPVLAVAEPAKQDNRWKRWLRLYVLKSIAPDELCRRIAAIVPAPSEPARSPDNVDPPHTFERPLRVTSQLS
jgi:hypothetical protein